ncbi:MAG: family 10 glycosylhydrolase [Phycisphaeraceae bacterium]|nr:family 10 glycosylhydrolase [Phycisphaeraceae bacterium]
MIELPRALLLTICFTLTLRCPAQPVWRETTPEQAQAFAPPDPPREFRGVWVASVQNIDWPSASNLSVEIQKAEIIRNLDGLEKMKFNAVLLQVRPSCDALYISSIEPWSEYLTGASGISPPAAGYDPLRFWIEEAHRRAIDVHIWINPFRARHFKAKSPNAASHISRTNPAIVKEYDSYEWLDPGEPEAVEHTMRVVMDIVNRYDIDGVAIDDYFYPYPKEGVPFPDNASYEKYAAKMRADAPPGTAIRPLTRDLWRQQNINSFVERFYSEIKRAKPYVLVGVAPFGIWKPGFPEGIKGMDAVAKLHADARLWLMNGWLDYLSPQLYWSIDSVEQNFVRLMLWWAQQNTKERHLWPSLYTSRIGLETEDVSRNWIPMEIVRQINVTRERSGNPGFPEPGQIHFSLKVMLENRGGINQAIMSVQPESALIPESPWLNEPAFSKIDWKAIVAADNTRTALAWIPWEFPLGPSRWVLQVRRGGEWRTLILPGGRAGETFETQGADTIALTPVSRTGALGRKRIWHAAQNGSN